MTETVTWMNIEEAAAFIKLKPKTVINYMHKGKIPFYKSPTGTKRLVKEELELWLRGELKAPKQGKLL